MRYKYSFEKVSCLRDIKFLSFYKKLNLYIKVCTHSYSYLIEGNRYARGNVRNVYAFSSRRKQNNQQNVMF